MLFTASPQVAPLHCLWCRRVSGKFDRSVSGRSLMIQCFRCSGSSFSGGELWCCCLEGVNSSLRGGYKFQAAFAGHKCSHAPLINLFNFEQRPLWEIMQMILRKDRRQLLFLLNLSLLCARLTFAGMLIKWKEQPPLVAPLSVAMLPHPRRIPKRDFQSATLPRLASCWKCAT